MSSNMNKLLLAWASSLILVVGGVLLLEATYDPTAPQGVGENPEQPEVSGNDTPQQEADGESPSQIAAENSAPPTENPQAALSAPGQPAPTQPTAASTIPDSIPVQPLASLLEQSNLGPLPKVADDGRQSFDVYAAPRVVDRTKGRIAILMTDLGKKARNTRRAIDELPANVSLGFWLYGSNLHEWGQKARAAGHEVFLGVPMEPLNYPQNDPGPLTLLTSQDRRTKLNLLRSSLAKFSGYVGVVNYMGSRFTAASDSIRPVLDELKRRGLMFVDNRDNKYSMAASMAQGINMPWAVNNGYIDDELDAATIAAALDELEKRARVQGTALGIARPYPVTVRAINVWAATLEEKGFILTPVTSIASQQALPR